MEETYLSEILSQLETLNAFYSEARTPIDFPVQISTSMSWSVDYRNRKHLYVLNPTGSSKTLLCEDYGSIIIPNGVWYPLDLPPGMKVYDASVSSPYYLLFRATDETPPIYPSSLTASLTLPTGTPGETVANPSNVLQTENFLLGWNGATWDRLKELNGGLATQTMPTLANANSQGFTASTGLQTSGGAITTGLSVFNPNASGKTLYIFSIKIAVASGTQHSINKTTSDPALGSAATVSNNRLGSGTASVANSTFQNTAVTPSGTLLTTTGTGGNTVTEVLTNGEVYVIPPNNGIELLITTSTNAWQANIMWIEQ